jgi:hypothetical protein
MLNRKVKLSAILLVNLAITGLQAQETGTVSGSKDSGSGGQAGYTIEPVVYNTVTWTKSPLTKSIKQPYEISVLKGIEDSNGITLICTAYPNPATDFIKLKVENFSIENLAYQLYSSSGKLLENKRVEGSETTISVKDFVPATYFLKLMHIPQTLTPQEIITFRIIKN